MNHPSSLLATQLPMWPEPVRGGPNVLLRSALFAGIASKKRKILGTQTRPEKKPEGVIIAAEDGIKISFAGTQFNQYDADVFFETLHLARREKLETECLFQGAGFLRRIGRSDTSTNYEDLEESLDRLRRGSLDIEWTIKGHRFVFSGSLVSHYMRETTTKVYKITFAKEIATLFAPASWTQIEWEDRLALKGKPLAQWLHSYYSTHAAPFPVTVGFLHEKCGSPTKLLKHFKTELKNAFAALESTLGWVASWDGDLVSITKPPSGSQGRHLTRRAEKQKQVKKGKREGQMVPVGELLTDILKDQRRRR
jgi:hypothetical protein